MPANTHHRSSSSPSLSSSSPALLLQQASAELEALRRVESSQFPSACRRLLRSLPGNTHCADCGNVNPDWASITYGSLYCLLCSGRHRSYGVATSVVRSVHLDAWTHKQVLAVLEGGNGQLERFLDRHFLGRQSPKANCRYHTKAARFYATHLRQHVHAVAEAGVYKGREASRLLYQSQPSEEQATISTNVEKLPQQPPQQPQSNDGVATTSSSASKNNTGRQPVSSHNSQPITVQ